MFGGEPCFTWQQSVFALFYHISFCLGAGGEWILEKNSLARAVYGKSSSVLMLNLPCAAAS
jgi:hypothetical protein